MRWDREKLLKPDSHVYGENGAKFMVYNMKRNPKKGGGKTKAVKLHTFEEIILAKLRMIFIF